MPHATEPNLERTGSGDNGAHPERRSGPVHQPGFALPGQGSCPGGQLAVSSNGSGSGRNESVQAAEVRLRRVSGRPQSCVSFPVHDMGGRGGALTPHVRTFLPSLFQGTQACPLLGFRVKTLHRVKELPVGAAADGVDLFVHGGVAADLKGKRSQSQPALRGYSVQASTWTSCPGDILHPAVWGNVLLHCGPWSYWSEASTC